MTKAFDEFPIAIAAYIADTQHLSTLQHGAYLLLLMTMRRAGGWVPDDDRKLANIAKMTLAKWKQIAPDIRSLLVAEDGKLSQKRVLSDIEKHRVLGFKNASNGKAGGIAKSLKSKEPGVATATISLDERQKPSVAAIPSLTVQSPLSEISKKERNSSGRALPSDWVPDDRDYAYGEKVGIAKADVDSCAEDMRLWARANANRAVGRKADWSSTFHGWMRREAPKIIRQRGFTTGGNNGKTQTASSSRSGFGNIAARIRNGDRFDDDSGRPTPENLQPVNGR